jgi:uncharacterized protein YndB with AHSA1/START domain
MRDRIRGLFGDQLLRRPPPVGAAQLVDVGPLDVRRTVLVDCPPDRVWGLLTDGDGSAAQRSDVTVVPMTEELQGRAWFVTTWLRANGRVHAGVSTIDSVEPLRIVASNGGGAVPMRLTTTVDAADQGTAVTQHLEIGGAVAQDDRMPRFANAWLDAELVRFKSLAESSSFTPETDHWLRSQLDEADGHDIPGARPIEVGVDVLVRVPLAEVWDLLVHPQNERLFTAARLAIQRAELPELGEVVVSLRDSDGIVVGVSTVRAHVDEVRIVERSLTAAFDSGVETVLRAVPGGTQITETLLSWLPLRAGATSVEHHAAEALMARLEVVRQAAEAGLRSSNDPHARFRPPESRTGPAADPVAEQQVSIPAAVILPPPVVPPAVPPPYDPAVSHPAVGAHSQQNFDVSGIPLL